VRTLLTIITLSLALSIGRAQQPALRQDGYAPELVNLQNEYRKALDAYYAPFDRAKSDEERQKIRLDPKKDPSRSLIPRFQALSRRAAGTGTGARALLAIIEIDRSDAPTSSARRALDDLIAGYCGTSIMEEMVETLRYVPRCLGRETVLTGLRRIIARSSIRAARAAALLNIARITLDDSETTEAGRFEAKKSLERLRKQFADTRAGRAADHALFELDNLQVGMTAPDFEATDEVGRRFRLSEYRGKVVVLDFWGFW